MRVRVLLALLAAATAAPPQSAPADRLVRLEAKALDWSTMLRRRPGHGGPSPESGPAEVPLADVEVTVLLPRSGAAGPEARKARTDASGTFRVDLGALPQGTRVELMAGSASPGSRIPKWYARPLEVGGDPLPGEVRFYEVGGSPDGIVQSVMQIATTHEEGGRKLLRVRHTVRVENGGFHVWMGDLSSADPASFRFPIPEGFEARELKVDGRGLRPETEALAHGGRGVVWRGPIFPTLFREDAVHVFFALLTRPCEDGDVLDVGMHLEHPVDVYSLSLEEPGLVYVPPEPDSRRVALADGGPQPPMGIVPKATRTWLAQGIPPHADVAATFRVGKPPLHPRTVWIVTLIALVLVVSIGTGWYLGTRTKAAPAGPSPRQELLRKVEEIASRAAGRGIEGRGSEDLRTLASAVAELLRGKRG